MCVDVVVSHKIVVLLELKDERLIPISSASTLPRTTTWGAEEGGEDEAYEGVGKGNRGLSDIGILGVFSINEESNRLISSSLEVCLVFPEPQQRRIALFLDLRSSRKLLLPLIAHVIEFSVAACPNQQVSS